MARTIRNRRNILYGPAGVLCVQACMNKVVRTWTRLYPSTSRWEQSVPVSDDYSVIDAT